MVLRCLCILVLCASAADGQQFTNQSGAIPGTVRWSEGVECSDVDLDGDLDIFFADGEGFASPGTQRQNVLIINLLETTAFTFADESVSRLGAHASNAKMVITGDIQGDGYEDAIFCNAFFTDPPSLYVNQGSGSPGFFTFEGASRGFTTSLSSGSGQFADVDNDGDLDVVLNDAYLGASAAEPVLYVNDGTGNFGEDSAFTAAAPDKSAQMDVQIVDIDEDWNLDVIAVCRAENGSGSHGDHYLMLGDGAGGWTDASNDVPDGSSGGVYEAEVGDLDGDEDLDLFFLSLSGFAEGPVKSNLKESSGTLSFSTGSALGSDDDNELALYDYDNDGDYDCFVGSLAFAGGEKVLVNNGSLSFSVNSSLIEQVPDSTLDLTIADLDNDGAYDVITAQGESNSSQWANKVYENTGAADALSPIFVREETLPMSGSTGTWVVRAAVRDEVMDDGKDWLSGEARYVVSTTEQDVAVDVTGGGWSNAAVVAAAGTTVTWTNQDTLAHSVVGTTPAYAFDSGPLGTGETFRYTFVSTGAYGYTDGIGGAGAASVTVNTAPTVQAASRAAAGVYRFQMDDTAGGTGVELAYELVMTDWAGNSTVSTSVKVPLARVDARNAGTNPASFTAGKPVLGGTFTAAVDLAGSTGHTFAVPFAFDTPVSLTLGGGQTLLIFDVGGNGELLSQGSQAGATPSWNIPVPASLALVGFELSAQAVQFGGVTPYALSNAQDLVIGY